MIGRDGFAVYLQRFGSTKRAKPLITSTLFLPSTFYRKYEYGRYRRYGWRSTFPSELVDGGIETIIRAVHMDRFTICAACHITFFGTQPTFTQVRPALWLQSVRISGRT